MTPIIWSCDVGHGASVAAHNPIRFHLAQQWHKEVPCQRIHHVQPQLIAAHLQQCPEPLRVIRTQREQSLRQLVV